MATKLKDLLAPLLTEKERELFVGSYDIVGDIAIINIPEELLDRKQRIGETILQLNKNVLVVARRVGQYRGEFRTVDLEIIAGEERKETLITEFGVRLLVNVETTYFSVRSGNERRRIASLVQPGERVLVLFSGIGPYPLVIAKHSNALSVVGVEKNPQAHDYAIKNIGYNKKINNVRFYLLDVSGLAGKLEGCFDRIVMPLPVGGDLFLGEALELLEPDGGTIHYYEMAREGSFDEPVRRVEKAIKAVGRVCKTAAVTRCGHCGPRSYRVCVDAQIL